MTTIGLPKTSLVLDHIIVGDALSVLRVMRSNSVDLVVTSPPYYDLRKYSDFDIKEIGHEASIDEYVNALLAVFKECVRVIKPSGSILFNIGDRTIKGSMELIPYRFAMRASNNDMGVKLINTIHWVKKNPTPRQYQRRLIGAVEPVFHFVKSEDYKYNYKDFQDDNTSKRVVASKNVGSGYYSLIEKSTLTDIQKAMARAELDEAINEARNGFITGLRMKIKGIHAPAYGGQSGGRQTHMNNKGFTLIKLYGNKMKRDVIETNVESIAGINHPAVYPVKLVEELIKLTTDVGDVVLDPFMGSGSTAVACVNTGRHYVGIDLSEDYVITARERVDKLKKSV